LRELADSAVFVQCKRVHRQTIAAQDVTECTNGLENPTRRRLKEFDRIAGIVQYDLRAARSRHDIAPKRQASFS
jgi:hypothetical protein